MKTALLTLAILTTALATFGQGKVGFGNDSTRLFVLGYGLPADPVGPIPQSPLPSGKTLQALLYAGTIADSLALQTAVPLTGANWLSPGRMAIKNISLSGIPGGSPAYFKVLWADTDGIPPATMDGNLSHGIYFSGFSYVASSELFTAVPGASILYNPLYDTTGPASSTWQSGAIINYLIPEPSSFALTVMGLTVLLSRRRTLCSHA